jgi:hypothetical protein
MRRGFALGLLAGTLALSPALVQAQAAPAPAGTETLLAVGKPAPDFELTGTTRFGILANKVKLSDFRGKTVVLAFFFRARTPG